MEDVHKLIGEIEGYCRQHGLAESTFGRIAVNDGKFVGRLRAGRSVTTRTVSRVRAFMGTAATEAETVARPANGGANGHAAGLPAVAAAQPEPEGRAFRFYDNRQKYLMFVNTCSEKWVISERVGMELAQIRPSPPALRMFDAGVGDGTVMSRVLRDMHRRHPTVPFLVVGKEISLEDVRLALEKVPDRLFEHPPTVLAITNLYYSEAPWLMPRSLSAAAALNWHAVPLRGNTAHDFDEQIKGLLPLLTDGWQVRPSEKTGNPLYVRPSVLVLYREDQHFIVDPIIPRPGRVDGQYDLILASQPYRARMSAEFKVTKVLGPLAQALAPGGRMLGIHSHGQDPGLEIIQGIWPGRTLEQTSRHVLMKELKSHLGRAGHDLRFNTYSDRRALFRYDMHTLPTEIDAGTSIGTSTLFAAWNAAIYVYQIEDDLITEAIGEGNYLDATREVLQRHRGLWFMDESYVVSRKRS
ncbi:hypothetical protein ACFOGJ_12715 [Marinibaculum pumilum]|uniref:Class I SAM-dependent methyltransferase n=1 Tax=Marinibaculum pumilum TaxID=1766165 RepID=A0ABV7L0E9_9PROT